MLGKKLIAITGSLAAGDDWISKLIVSYLSQKYNKTCYVISINKIAEEMMASNGQFSPFFNDVRAFLKLKRSEEQMFWIDKVLEAINQVENLNYDYIILQGLKCIDEILALKEIYGNNFYLLGLDAEKHFRKSYFYSVYKHNNDFNLFDILDQQDKKDKDVEKCIDITEYIINSNNFLAEELKDAKTPDEYIKGYLSANNNSSFIKHIIRFCNLAESPAFEFPAMAEYAMVEAYTASLNSRCLSVQVGAVITDKFDRIISVGWNDLPKSQNNKDNEGVSTLCCMDRFHPENLKKINETLPEEMNTGEHKEMICFEGCYATAKLNKRKDKIKREIIKTLTTNTNIQTFSEEEVDKLAVALMDKIVEIENLDDIQEVTRAVHAEQYAIIRMAHSDIQNVSSLKMYVTEFPCNDCLKLMIAAGIREIIFIGPYRNVVCQEMYPEAIYLERDMEKDIYTNGNGKYKNKVIIKPFQGVKAYSFFRLFRTYRARKDEGTGLMLPVHESNLYEFN